MTTAQQQRREWLVALAQLCQLLAAGREFNDTRDIDARIRSLLQTMPDDFEMPERALALILFMEGSDLITRSAGGYRHATSASLVGCELREWSTKHFPTICRNALKGQLEQLVLENYADPRIKRALKFILTNYQEPRLRLRRLAQDVQMSPCHLSRLLKRESGYGFLHHLHDARVAEAERLLVTTLMSVKEIACRVGYDGTAQLDRHFKRLRGSGPSALRAAIPARGRYPASNQGGRLPIASQRLDAEDPRRSHSAENDHNSQQRATDERCTRAR